MDLEKMLKEYRESIKAVPREERIAQTVRLSGEAFFQREQERMLSYAEFLRTQFLVLKKRWWVYQCLLLMTAGLLLGNMQEEYYMRRSVGDVEEQDASEPGGGDGGLLFAAPDLCGADAVVWGGGCVFGGGVLPGA